MKRHGRIAIVFPLGNLDTVPSLCNMAVLLAEQGYWVDFYTVLSDNYVPPEFEGKRISIVPASGSGSYKQTRWSLLSHQLSQLLYLRVWQLQWLSRHLQMNYACVIGVDPHGLIAAKAISQGVKVPLAYYSLELLLSYELITDQDRELKSQELVLSRQAAFVIIQDEERAGLLIRDNQLAPERVICVPNAPLGLAARQHSDYLRRKFDLSPDAKVILQSGSIRAWAGLHQLMRSTQEWPDDWVLVCHTQSKAAILNWDYIAALKYMAKPGRVIFSTDPVGREEYAALVRSADLGVVAYQEMSGSHLTQDNLRYIGLSSGKLAYYLQSGLPVVVNENPSLRRLITTYGCGEVAGDLTSTVHAIEGILTDYDTYSHNAVRCFSEQFDFAGKFSQVLVALESLGH